MSLLTPTHTQQTLKHTQNTIKRQIHEHSLNSALRMKGLGCWITRRTCGVSSHPIQKEDFTWGHQKRSFLRSPNEGPTWLSVPDPSQVWPDPHGCTVPDPSQVWPDPRVCTVPDPGLVWPDPRGCTVHDPSQVWPEPRVSVLYLIPARYDLTHAQAEGEGLVSVKTWVELLAWATRKIMKIKLMVYF